MDLEDDIPVEAVDVDGFERRQHGGTEVVRRFDDAPTCGGGGVDRGKVHALEQSRGSGGFDAPDVRRVERSGGESFVEVGGRVLEVEARVGTEATIRSHDVRLPGVPESECRPIAVVRHDTVDPGRRELGDEDPHRGTPVEHGRCEKRHRRGTIRRVPGEVDDRNLSILRISQHPPDERRQCAAAPRSRLEVRREVDLLGDGVHDRRRAGIDEEDVIEPESAGEFLVDGLHLGMHRAPLRSVPGVVDARRIDADRRRLSEVGRLEVGRRVAGRDDG